MSISAEETGQARSAREFLEDVTGEPLTFGGFLRAIRQGEEMTLAELSGQLGISRQNLCDIEHARRPVSPARAAEWAGVLGYSEAQFVRLSLQDQVSRAGLDLRVSVDTA